MWLKGQVLDQMLDHVLDHKIIGLVTRALQDCLNYKLFLKYTNLICNSLYRIKDIFLLKQLLFIKKRDEIDKKGDKLASHLLDYITLDIIIIILYLYYFLVLALPNI